MQHDDVHDFGPVGSRDVGEDGLDHQHPCLRQGGFPYRGQQRRGLVFHVFAALAEFIRELIAEGTREGLDAARARGQRLGRPPAMTAEQIRQARDMLTLPRNSISSIARLLGVSRSTLYKHLPELASGHRPAAQIPPPGPGSGPGWPSRHRRQPARMPDPAITRHQGGPRCDAGQVTGTDPRHLADLTEAQRDQAMARWQVLRPQIEDGVPLARLAGHGGVADRTLQRWAARYRADGLAGLARRERADRGARQFPDQLQLLIEGLAVKRPPPSIATIHRDVTAVARQHGWPVPSYATVHDVVRHLDPALVVLAHEGTRRYEELYDLVYRREASKPNEIWQADHTQLDLWVVAPSPSLSNSLETQE
ncbi:MAG TPA: helix-turn-helix domain-containing protein [Trebonia sp.]|nr:helix-turn-helix domain-containing protein [Trebonia sp.]